MALTNVVGSGGYTVVNIHEYYKQHRHMGLEIITYSDSTKTLETNRFGLNVKVFGEEFSVISKALASPPGSPSEEDKYVVADNGTGDWSGKDGKVMLYNGTDWEELATPEQLVVEDENKLYHWNGSDWIEDKCCISETAWDSWFGIASISADGENMIKKAYDFIKSLPNFSGVVDA